MVIDHSRKYHNARFVWHPKILRKHCFQFLLAGLEITTDTVANATNIFSLVTKNSGLVAKVATRFLYILDLN